MLVALLVFCVVIVIHELGHFVAAKRCGIYVHEFAIGMGPVILKKQGKETLYSIRLFPIGGYVKMEGEDEESASPRAFNSKSVLDRMSVISAGVIMNVILAIICLMIVNYNMATPTVEIGEVIEGFPAQQAGLQVGDKITKINNNNVLTYSEISYELMMTEDAEVSVEYERNGEKTKVLIERQLDAETGSLLIGFAPKYKLGSFYKAERTEEQTVTIVDTIVLSVQETISYMEITVKGFIQLVTLQLPLDYMSGPVGIVSTLGGEFNKTLEQYGIMLSIISTIKFIGIISVNLAVFNFLPLPALDGGRFVFLMYEAITKKPVPAEKEGYVHFVGFVLLMGFALFITYRDIMNLF